MSRTRGEPEAVAVTVSNLATIRSNPTAANLSRIGNDAISLATLMITTPEHQCLFTQTSNGNEFATTPDLRRADPSRDVVRPRGGVR